MNRTRALLGRPCAVVDGYLDVMGDGVVPQPAAQRVMGSTVLPRIYEKLRLLGVGDMVLDVACGPGDTNPHAGWGDGREAGLVGVTNTWRPCRRPSAQ